MEKPKVRFCQSDCVNNVLEFKQSVKEKPPKPGLGKAKIISDVPVNIPIKFLADGKILLCKNSVEQNGLSNLTVKNSEVNKNKPSGTGNAKTVEIIDISDDETDQCISGLENLKIDDSKTPLNTENLNDHMSNDILSTSNITYRSRNKKSHSINSIGHDAQSNKKRQFFLKTQQTSICEKENPHDVMQSKTSNAFFSSDSSNILNDKTNMPKNKIGRKSSKSFMKRKSESSKTPVTKVMQVMPCYKSKIPGTKKLSPNKHTNLQYGRKSLLQNALGTVNRASTKPTVLHTNPVNSMSLGKNDNFLDNAPGNILNLPEYSSTISLIEELKRKHQKISRNHLPLSYKNLINAKVSASLDFAPDEAVFKDLIDLTVDDSELPSRLTRSKDPEPRPRDEVPQLSDFLIPEYAPEYFTTASIVPPTPTNVDTYNAFKVSDKIHTWKCALDEV